MLAHDLKFIYGSFACSREKAKKSFDKYLPNLQQLTIYEISIIRTDLCFNSMFVLIRDGHARTFY